MSARGATPAPASDSELRAVQGGSEVLVPDSRSRGLDVPAERPDPTHDLAVEADEPVAAGLLLDLATKVEQLEQGMKRRTVIGQAQGILIERLKVTADVAFAVLVRSSSVTNRKLYDVAAELVLTGKLPDHR